MSDNLTILKKYWNYLTHGLNPTEINYNHGSQKEFNGKGIDNILEEIYALGKNEYLVIDEDQIILPRFQASHLESKSKTFKKEHPCIEVRYLGTENSRKLNRQGPQNILKETIDYYAKYGKVILRRGIAFYQGERHFIMPQDDLMTGYRLAGILSQYDVLLKVNNTKNHFTMELKSTSDPFENDEKYIVILSNLAQNNNDLSHFSKWPFFSFVDNSLDNRSLSSDKYNSINPKNQKYPELIANFKISAVYILRYYFGLKNKDEALKSKLILPKDFEPLDELAFNLFLEPKKRRIDLELKLSDQVYIKRKSINKSTGKISVKSRSLTNAEKEALFSYDLYMNGFDNTFIYDENKSKEEKLNNLEEIFSYFKSYWDDKINQLKLYSEILADEKFAKENLTQEILIKKKQKEEERILKKQILDQKKEDKKKCKSVQIKASDFDDIEYIRSIQPKLEDHLL